jgi:creatinine amidohydrolase
MNTPPEVFPEYRSRYLGSMTLKQIAALPDKAWAPVVMAIGAIEQHGPHLPVAVDAFIGEAAVAMAVARLPAGASCYVAPPLTVGKSNEHTGFPGTLMISKGTLRALLLATARQVKEWGFKSLAIINTHGGNSAVAIYTAREIKATLGLRVEFIWYNAQLDISAQERAFGYHANEVETAWLLALSGHRVKMERAVCDYAGKVTDPGDLRAEQTAATFSWISQDVSKSGVMGDATAGTEEKGRRWLAIVGHGYAQAIAKLGEEMKAAQG